MKSWFKSLLLGKSKSSYKGPRIGISLPRPGTERRPLWLEPGERRMEEDEVGEAWKGPSHQGWGCGVIPSAMRNQQVFV